jgi:phospholipid-transporting ATPase
MSGMYLMLFTTAVFWLGMFLIPAIAIIPDFLIKVIRGTIFKSLTDAVREGEIRKTGTDVFRGESKNS